VDGRWFVVFGAQGIAGVEVSPCNVPPRLVRIVRPASRCIPRLRVTRGRGLLAAFEI
jgi:hypothetical protein